jgi:D-alanyl-D-alanine carboxypeptidase
MNGSENWANKLRTGVLWLLSAGVAMAVMAASSLANVADAAEQQRIYINAKSAIVMDASTHKILYSKHADTPMYPASTTKLMTAILLVTHLKPDDQVYISEQAAHQHRVRLGLKADTYIKADDALHALLMKSANDVAYAVAESIGGSEEGFARMMNLKARLIGCTQTNFVTPNGLHDDEHMSTAHDLALILSEAITHPRIIKAMQTKEYSIAGRPFRNGNRMMHLTRSTFGQVVGGKTGYTSKAMYCLALAAQQHGQVRVSVVLGAPRKSYMYRETRRLLELSYKHKAAAIV